MSTACPETGSLVEAECATIATEYREAQALQAYARGVLRQVEEATQVVCSIPSFFDIDTSVGHQLTLVGKRLGFPRCHCTCDTRPVFGFKCAGETRPYPTAGFCQPGIWAGCGGVSDLCIENDEVYRAHLKIRRYQILGLYDLESLGLCVRTLWGEVAWIPRARGGQVVLAPGRALTAEERQRLPVSLRVLPIAPGIRIAVHFGTKRIAGFGAGWAGFCDTPSTQPVFGFPCPDGANVRPQRGFCADDAVWTNCVPAPPSAGQWLCPVPIDPYACA